MPRSSRPSGCQGSGQQVLHRHHLARLSGVEFDTIAEEVARRHATAYPRGGIAPASTGIEIGGEYQWRREGEPHLSEPEETVFRLQHATRAGRYDVFEPITSRVDEQSERLMTLRGLFRFKRTSKDHFSRAPVPLDEVEPVSSLVTRFSTGAMSYGSISKEARGTMAIAMNRLGGKSNTGEGGEDAERLYDPDGAARSSRSRPDASGSPRSTSPTPTTCRGGTRMARSPARAVSPGHKVYPWVAETRHSTPGVGLISPPPHHDIYWMETSAS